jgi:glycerol-3-phosphate O-acyltransferase
MSVLTGRFWALFTRAQPQPEDIAAQLTARAAPVCYVFETASDTDMAVLRRVCTASRLPRPTRRLPGAGLRAVRAVLALQRPVGFWTTRLDRRAPLALLRMHEEIQRHPTSDFDLVTVAVYWGRAPQKERSLIRLVLADSWVIASRIGRLFTILINGRRAVVQFGAPVSFRSLAGDASDPAVAARRVARQLRAQLERQRTARIGPDLSHRRTILAEVLRTRAVRAAVAQLVDDKVGMTRRQGLLEARKIGKEIAANYSHTFVAIMYRVCTWMWNRLYDGVQIGNLETLGQVADGNELVYVPCHRSSIDDMLLPYAVYQHGFAIPHTAAGINLNLPVVGRFMRKGGAFFIRRSFRGNALYSAVMTKYLGAIMARGHSLEYFIEGGRSRTGRLLAPSTGMLSMTILSFLREPKRPVVFVPVYFGYERIFEGKTYLGELSGKPKEKESFFGLVQSIWMFLRERYGRVHVNFGEPIHLNERLKRHSPGWIAKPMSNQERPRWVVALADELADDIMRNINSAAAVTPVNLLALALLATPRQATLENGLIRQIETLLALHSALPYHARVTVTKQSPKEIIDYGIALKIVFREKQRAGDFIRMSAENTVLATYYRNNVLHLVALPSMLACCFIGNAGMRTEDAQRLTLRIYPYVASELFLRWNEQEIGAVVQQTLAAMASIGLLQHDVARDFWSRPAPTSAEATQLSLLAQSTVQIVERYYLAIALLVRAGSAQMNQKVLAERCQLMAQRMTLLYGFNSPEFFDRALFANFIDLLRKREVLRTDNEGKLLFDEVLVRVAEDAELVLSEQIRHSILQVVHD